VDCIPAGPELMPLAGRLKTAISDQLSVISFICGATALVLTTDHCLLTTRKRLALAELEPLNHPTKQKSLVGDPDS
jgi:hypothetical protein